MSMITHLLSFVLLEMLMSMRMSHTPTLACTHMNNHIHTCPHTPSPTSVHPNPRTMYMHTHTPHQLPTPTTTY